MSIDSLWDEIDGRMTAVAVKFPDTALFLKSFHKHVKFAVANPSKTDHQKLLRKGRDWLTMVMWKHPMFRDDFQRMVEAIDKFKKEHDGQLGETAS